MPKVRAKKQQEGKKPESNPLQVLVRDLERSIELNVLDGSGQSRGACSTYCSCSGVPVR